MIRIRISLLLTLAAAVFSASVLLAPGAAQAQQQDPLRAKGDKACKTDARKLCSKFFGQGDMVVLSCFQQNKRRLTKSCHSFLVEVGQLY